MSTVGTKKKPSEHFNSPFLKAYSGKRVRQNSTKLKQMSKRDRRLRKIGLSLKLFEYGFNAVEYFRTRQEARRTKKAGAK